MRATISYASLVCYVFLNLCCFKVLAFGGRKRTYGKRDLFLAHNNDKILLSFSTYTVRAAYVVSVASNKTVIST
jgi:hypothetical protein